MCFHLSRRPFSRVGLRPTRAAKSLSCSVRFLSVAGFSSPCPVSASGPVVVETRSPGAGAACPSTPLTVQQRTSAAPSSALRA